MNTIAAILRSLTIFLVLLTATVFGLTPEAGAFGPGAVQIQLASPAGSAGSFAASQPFKILPVAAVSASHKTPVFTGFFRPRYLNPQTGRFWTRDSYFGIPSQPETLNKYLYAYADPVGFDDETGLDPSLTSLQQAQGNQLTIAKSTRVAAKAARCAANKIRGLAASKDFAKLLRDNGYKVFEEITVRTPFGRRRIDIVVQTASGFFGIEAKSGGAVRSIEQIIKDTFINLGGAKAVGAKAECLGIDVIQSTITVLAL